jgi:exodeoxyribonuclease V alpha subunit
MAEMDIAAAQNVLSALFGDRPDDWQKIAAAVLPTAPAAPGRAIR